jgi:hypothetical protein
MDVDETIKELQQQMIMQNFQQLISQITPKCYKLCVFTPGLKLSTREIDCLEMCKDNYQESTVLISQSFLKRIGEMQNLS